jgi:hypothetical protein
MIQPGRARQKGETVERAPRQMATRGGLGNKNGGTGGG